MDSCSQSEYLHSSSEGYGYGTKEKTTARPDTEKPTSVEEEDREVGAEGEEVGGEEMIPTIFIDGFFLVVGLLNLSCSALSLFFGEKIWPWIFGALSGLSFALMFTGGSK